MSLYSRFALNEQNRRVSLRILWCIVAGAAVWVLVSFVATKTIRSPRYIVVSSEAGYQVREYESYIVAQVAGADSFERALYDSGSLLLRYIRGENTRQEAVAMRRPEGVTAQSSRERMAYWAPIVIGQKNQHIDASVILPSDVTIVTAPRPNNPTIRILQVPATVRAVVLVSGSVPYDETVRLASMLRELLARDNRVILSAASAMYVGPSWAPSFLRRTEISFVIRN